MRMYILLILTAIFLSFQTAYFVIRFQTKTTASQAEIEEIFKFKKDFEEKNTPLLEIDLNSMYPSRLYSELFRPMNVFSREMFTTKTYFSRPCVIYEDKMSKASFNKSETWEDFRCKRISKLPSHFFEIPPLVHESGVSYAFLAHFSGRDPFSSSEWVRSNLNLFHLYELRDLPINALEGNFKVLALLKRNDLEALVRGFPYIVTEEYYLRRDREDFNVAYKIYSKAQLDDFLKEKIYFIKPYQRGEQCFFRELRFCWEKDGSILSQFFMQSSIAVFLGSVIVLILIGVILYKKISQQRFEEERKKHALRVLTHELRTPVANLMLLVEQINKESDIIPASVLEDFLKVEGEVYRLKRLAEKSTSYLQINDEHSLIFITYQKITSLNELVENMLNDYLDKGIIFIPLVKDRSFNLDIYWFGICVKNLVENALFHGMPPVEVRLESKEDGILLSVIDQGICPYKNLEELLSSDRRGKNAQGLGLGMSIVKKIMKEMDGKLIYIKGNPSPTTFSLFLRNKE